MVRKRRTREHVIADLAVNQVERYALLAGYTVDRFVHDYGLDLILVTYDATGEVESGPNFLQLKATDSPSIQDDRQTVAFRVERADLSRWLAEWVPVILVVYDAGNDAAYWVHIQEYFAGFSESASTRTSGTVTIRIPMANRVDVSALRRFARLRDEEQARIREEVRRRG